jgi:putative DNA primase/helicase
MTDDHDPNVIGFPPGVPKRDSAKPKRSPRPPSSGNGKDKGPAGGIISARAPYDTARLFQSGLNAPLKYHRGAFYEWNGSAWPLASEDMPRARLYAFLDRCRSRTDKGALCPVKPTRQMVSNVIDALRGAACIDEKIAAPAWIDGIGPAPAELVACANGLLHLSTRRLLPNTPSFFNYNALDFDYDPKAPEPRQWLSFLHQLWPSDTESVTTLQEFFGYFLTAHTSQQKAMMLIGPKRSGKGTIGRVLNRLIGAHNCCSPTLADLGDQFGREPLIGKSLAIICDARLSGRADQKTIVERLLSITGEDSTTIPRKYLKAWTGTLTSRFVLVSNELPKLDDASGALAGRFILLMLTISFYGREDPTLTNTLLRELSGIFNWALDGWDRLRERGYFQQPASAKAEMEQLEDLASPIGAFLRERCDIGAAYSAAIDEVFGAWQTWCEAQGRDHPGTKQSFGRDLRAAHSGLKTTQSREGGERFRAYQGLRLKPWQTKA